MALDNYETGEKLNNREKGLVRMRSITNYVMGFMIIAAGVVFLFPPKALQPKIDLYNTEMIKLMAILCFIYGGFRIFRGYKKNYFRDN
jgi:NADH:ubiquinone oxidoreductase subunit 3 (subunit A)